MTETEIINAESSGALLTLNEVLDMVEDKVVILE